MRECEEKMSKIKVRYDFIYQDTKEKCQKCTKISFKTYLLNYKQSIQLKKYTSAVVLVDISTEKYLYLSIFVQTLSGFYFETDERN